MAIKTEDKIIDGLNVSCTQFPARRCMLLQARTIKFVGPLFSGLKGATSDLSLDSDVSLDDAAQMLSGVASIKPEEFMQLSVDLLAGTRVNGVEQTESVIDLEYPDKYLTLYKIVLFSAFTNFKSLFPNGDISGLVARFKKAATKTENPIAS